MRNTTCCHIVIGPDGHGVVRHALRLARAARSPIVRLDDPADPFALPPGVDVAHLHVTDKLFGPTPAAAAGACTALADRLDVPVVIALHDVPLGDTDDIAKGRDRAYRQFAESADLVLVASRAEARRLRALTPGRHVELLALPAPRCRPVPRAEPDGRLGVLGFIYPGKGHSTVIEAAGTVRAGVVAVGGCSDGHTDLPAELHDLAAMNGVDLDITGPLSDARFDRHLATVAVPVVPSRRAAASASLMSWIGAGRRPLVATNEHSIDVAERLGDHVVLFDGSSAALAEAAAAALDDPRSTWSDKPLPDEMTVPGVVRRLAALIGAM